MNQMIVIFQTRGGAIDAAIGPFHSVNEAHSWAVRHVPEYVLWEVMPIMSKVEGIEHYRENA